MNPDHLKRENVMKIEVKLFATLRDYLPKGSGRFSCSMDCKDGALPYPYYAGLVSVPGEKSTGKSMRLNSGWRKAEFIP